MTAFVNNNSSCFLKSVDEARAPNLYKGATNMCAQTMLDDSGANTKNLSSITLLAIWLC